MQFSAAAAFTFFAALAAAASVEVSDVEVTKYVYTINGEIPAWKPKHVSLTLNGHQANNIFCEANIVAYPTDILKCADGSSYRFTLKQGGQFTGQEFGIGLYFDRLRGTNDIITTCGRTSDSEFVCKQVVSATVNLS